MTLSLSANGAKALKKEEGEVLEAYLDAGDPPTWTIGVGSTNPNYAFEGNKITKAKSHELFLADASVAENAVNRLVKVPLTQLQYDALVSLVFNIGSGAFAKSTLLKKLNRQDYTGASDEFLRWNRAGGKVLRGLANRRERERTMFLKGTGKIEPEHKLETNIIPDAVEAPRIASEPGVQATATLAAGGTLAQLTEQLEPLAGYSDKAALVLVFVSVVAFLFVLYKTKKKQDE